MKGATTPLTAARTSPKPDHPFETTNQFTTLSSMHDDSTDDGSGQSDDILLTPADGDVAVSLDSACNIAAVVAIEAPMDGTNPIDTAATSASSGKIAVQPDDAAAPHSTPLTLEAMIMANTVGINALRELMNENVAMVKELTQTMNNTSSHLHTLTTEFKDIKETAERSYRLALSANISITSQEARLLDLVNNLSRLTSDIDDLHASSKITQEITTLVQSAIEPVKASMDLSLALAIETAETAIKSSFDTLVTTLNDNVAESIKAFEKNIDALHGSSYGHLTKNTLPEFAHRIDAFEARDWPTATFPMDKVDPWDNANVSAKSDAIADDDNDAFNRRRRAAAADIDDGLDAKTQSYRS